MRQVHPTERSGRPFCRTLGAALLAALAVCAFGTPTVADATVVQYDIAVNVTAAPAAPGGFPSNPWNFPSGVPAVFSGTFEADDSIGGAITNLQLTIGGLDIAATHSFLGLNFFDPLTLQLTYAAFDPSSLESLVSFGAFFGGPPSNYAVAVENSFTPPLDPFLTSRQNWVGTVAITPTVRVPEPATTALLALGLLGAGFARKRRTH